MPHAGNEALNDGIQKALGFVLTSLGGSDDVLNKVTTLKQRLEMAVDAHKKATSACSEAKTQVEIAKKSATERIEAFTRQSEEAINYLKDDDLKKSALVRTTMNKIIGAHSDFVSLRQEAVLAAEEAVLSVQKADGAVADSLEWAVKVGEKMAKKHEALPEIPGEIADMDSCNIEFVLESSYIVSKLLEESGSGGDPVVAADSAANTVTVSDEDISAVAELIKEQPDGNSPDATESSSPSDRTPAPETTTTTTSFPNVAAFAAALLPTKDSKVLQQEAFDHHFGSSRSSEEDCKSSAVSVDETSDQGAVVAAESGGSADEDIAAPSAAVIESFSCCYWKDEKDNQGSNSLISPPLTHGRMFVTADAIYFVGWGHLKIILDHVECKSIQKEKAVLADNAISILMKDGKNYFFGSFAFRENCYQLINRLQQVKVALIEAGVLVDTSRAAKQLAAANTAPSSSSSYSPLQPVEDDAVIKNMDVVVKGRLQLSVAEFFVRFWEESEASGRFYGDWLTGKGSKEVSVTDWEEGSFPHKFSGESYTKKRIVKFLHPRTSHLWIGPPFAGVQQDQKVIINGPDKFVVVMTVEMSGIPYADVFAVEVRWVATRCATDASAVDVLVGVTVDFKKSTIMKSNIRSGTLEETALTHQLLFKAMEATVAAKAGGGGAAAAVAASAGLSQKSTPAPTSEGVVVSAKSSENSESLSAARKMTKKWGDTTSVALAVAVFLVLWLFIEVRRNRHAVHELTLSVERLEERLADLLRAVLVNNQSCSKK